MSTQRCRMNSSGEHENVPRKGTCPTEAEVPGEHTMLSVLEHGSEFKIVQQRRAKKLPLTSALSLQALAQITLQ